MSVVTRRERDRFRDRPARRALRPGGWWMPLHHWDDSAGTAPERLGSPRPRGRSSPRTGDSPLAFGAGRAYNHIVVSTPL